MTIRVVQWTTGNVGRQSVVAIVKNPDLELVAATRGLLTKWGAALHVAFPLITSRVFASTR